MRVECVSAVPPYWVAEVFLPSFAAAVERHATICWMVVESAYEGNYLLEKIGSWAKTRDRAVTEVVLDANDPLLVWYELFGSSSDEGLLAGTGRLVTCFNGCLLPVDFLLRRISFVRSCGRGMGACLIVPVFHGIVGELQAVVAAEDEVITVPRFASFPEASRIAVVRQLVDVSLLSLDEEEKEWFAREIILAGPNSRAEVEQWVDYYAGRGDVREAVRRDPPAPPLTRLPVLPPTCPTRAQLRASLEAAMLRLQEANDLFQAWQGRPLARRVSTMIDPFVSDDSLLWFTCTVSVLASQVFDGTEPAFRFLVRFAVGGEGVENSEPEPFFDTLRAIRTVLQHGLAVGTERDEGTRYRVKSWFEVHCGKPRPGRADWRRLTGRLIGEWERTALRLRDVIERLGKGTDGAPVAAQLRQFERRLSKDDWRIVLAGAISRINPQLQLDREAFLACHLARLQKELQRSVVAREEIWEAAQELMEGLVAREAARCPVTVDDLKGLGIEPGPLLARASAQAEAIWREKRQVTRDELLEEVARWREGLQ